ncbi:MAG: hypothetical protein LBG27_04655 [Spirochaetaceae bacterium]|nr:hypothetical protein [Spirochaetaceae bacterium]
MDTGFGAAVLKAQKVFTGSRAFYRLFVCFVSFHRKPPSRPLVKLIGCQISAPLSLFAFAIHSLPLCQLTELPQIQMSFGTGSSNTDLFSIE